VLGVEDELKVAVILYSLTSVDRLAAGSVAAGEVASLAHELGDHSVELAALVAEALLASAKSAEVLRGLRHNIVVQLEGDAPLRLATDVQIEEDLGVRHFQGGQARSNNSRRESKGRGLGEHDKEDGQLGKHDKRFESILVVAEKKGGELHQKFFAAPPQWLWFLEPRFLVVTLKSAEPV
jgi:hypothetical protein